MKQFLGAIVISSNASLVLFVLALSYPAATLTRLAVAGFVRNQQLSVASVEWLCDCDV